MTNHVTLLESFESNKPQLESNLQGLLVPKDSERIQNIIADYLNSLLDDEGDFRQNLTQSEDYILQAALSLLNAQKEIIHVLVSSINKKRLIEKFNPAQEIASFENHQSNESIKSSTQRFVNCNVKSTDALIGAGGGALLGKTIFGGWGAVFGAVAGIAVNIYLSNRNTLMPRTPEEKLNTDKTQSIGNDNSPIDIQTLVTITENICRSVDSLIASFRAQINRLVDKYENQEKPAFEKQYKTLLESLQSVIGYERMHSEDAKFVQKIKERIEDISELLENYNLTVVDYREDLDLWFDKVTTKNTQSIKMVYPAIIKGEHSVVLKGKIFIPEA